MNIGLLVAKGKLSSFRINTLKPILEDKNFNIKIAIIDERKGKTFKQKLIKNFKRGRGGYMIVMLLKKLFTSKKNAFTKSVEINDYCQEHQIETIKTINPYDETTLNTIKSYELDVLLLIGGYGIVKESLLNLTPQGVLSYHHGNMRKYRGMPPVFWELYNNEKEVGVTLQKLTAGLDCGLPIKESSVNIQKNDKLEELEKRLYKKSEPLMHLALSKLLDKDYKAQQITKFGKVYTLPNLREWTYFHLKMFFRNKISKKSSI